MKCAVMRSTCRLVPVVGLPAALIDNLNPWLRRMGRRSAACARWSAPGRRCRRRGTNWRERRVCVETDCGAFQGRSTQELVSHEPGSSA
jgi:hypothetical protein